MNDVYTPKQLEAMRIWQSGGLKRINIFEGSVSSGKTWVSLVMWAFWVKTMPADENSLYLMAGRSLTTLKRNCLFLLQELVGTDNFDFTLSSKEGRLFGRHVLLEGANDAQAESKIRGLTLQGAYIDEATKLPEDFFAMLLSRLRKAGAKLFGTTNPDAPMHWLKAKYLDRPDLNILDLKFKIDDNTSLEPEYVEAIKKEYTGVYYERFILGNWTLAEGLIYPMYMGALADPPEGSIPSEYRLSLDYGTMNAFAALMWERHGNIWYATHGYYYSGRDKGVTKTDEEYGTELDEFASQVTTELKAKGQKLKVIIDPSAASFIALLQKKGLYKVVKANNDVLDGIRETAVALEQGYIKISPSIKEWAEEAGSYVWDSSTGLEKPEKIRDHYMDGTRYMVKTERIVGKARLRQREGRS